MHTTRRNAFLYCCLLPILTVGCSSKPSVTISASHLQTDSTGSVTIGSTAKMTSNRPGAVVRVGGNDTEMVTVTLTNISTDHVTLDVRHPNDDAKSINMRLSQAEDVFFGDGSVGVRLEFSAAE